ncbi:epoxide hydrolase family protein [Paenibacillus tuaregi]|uniref:epoxide hydrolase family protein n=1 Tax=Paenibacillus tuaregi TaxID=1816681 RepID=UPI0008396118|nr:epoxide hydrolase family protein [Paenibacillus tuaregi]
MIKYPHSSTIGSTGIRPFRIDIPKDSLDDLKFRLARTRWPEVQTDAGWDYGVSLDYVKELAEYWEKEYDWRKHEARLNGYPQFITEIDGAQIHFMHVRSPESDALPLILTHGWPGSIVEFLGIIGPLTDPRAYGGNPSDAFHLVIPSIPGYGFSGPAQGTGWNTPRIAKAWAQLMSRLGYTRYGAHGGDAGSLISREMGIQQPEGLLGIHVMQLFSFPSGDPEEMINLSEDDQNRLKVLANFRERAGYNAIQMTRPQTLAFGLADSPSGQLAWIAELFNGFGDTVDSVDRDAFLTNVMLYWLTNTAESSARLYHEDAHQPPSALQGPNKTATGVAVFAHDFQSMRRFAERDNTNIVHWSEFDRGTHFAAMDASDLLASDLQSFFRRFR